MNFQNSLAPTFYFLQMENCENLFVCFQETWAKYTLAIVKLDPRRLWQKAVSVTEAILPK